jgi:hypothetical protein
MSAGIALQSSTSLKERQNFRIAAAPRIGPRMRPRIDCPTSEKPRLPMAVDPRRHLPNRPCSGEDDRRRHQGKGVLICGLRSQGRCRFHRCSKHLRPKSLAARRRVLSPGRKRSAKSTRCFRTDSDWTALILVIITPALWVGRAGRPSAQVAQLVEHVTENHGVGGSIPPLGTSVTHTPGLPPRPTDSPRARTVSGAALIPR